LSELADWEIEVIVSPEEQAQIDSLRREYTEAGDRDALTTRLASLQAEVDLTQAQLDALDVPVAEPVVEAAPEPTPEPEVPAETPEADDDAAETSGTGKSTDLSAVDAAAAAAAYSDAAALKAWAEGDDRKTVTAAVEKRLTELGG
jgi:hypothetical protein